MNNRNRIVSSILVPWLFSVLLLCSQLAAQEQRWVNASGGQFLDAANWDADVPDDSETALFDLDEGVTINLGADHSIGGLRQERGSVFLDGGFTLDSIGATNIEAGSFVLSGASTAFNVGGQLDVGDSAGSASLNLQAGAFLSSATGRIGSADGALSRVSVRGAGTQWRVGTNLLVGSVGSGRLEVVEEGSVRLGSSINVGNGIDRFGSVLVSGQNSTLVSSTGTSQFGASSILIDDRANASFANLIAGSTVDRNSLIAINGFQSSLSVSGATTIGGAGTASVSIGNDAQFSAGSILTLGSSATGEGLIRVTNGGRLTSNLSRIGQRAGASGEVSVTGNDSQWEITNQLFVGNSGNGTVNITAGGKTTVADSIRIGASDGSTGNMTISGIGSELTSVGLDVGFLGNGILSIDEGGIVNSQFANIGRRVDGGGSATVSGGGSQWNLSTSLSIGAKGNGSLAISEGGSVNALTTLVSQATNSTGNLMIRNSGSQLSTDSIVIGGSSSGVVTVEQGGLLQTHSLASVGASGRATVTGNESQWINEDDVIVAGQLTVSSGGALTSGTTYIGSAGTSGTVVVDGADSTWNNSLGLAIGRLGAGRLEILNGGTTSSQFASVSALGGSGSLLVDGTGSRLSIGNFSVGGDGDGIVMVANSGTIESSTLFVQSDGEGSQSLVTVTGNGSRILNSGDMQIGLNGSMGQVSIVSGGLISTDGAFIGDAGILMLDSGTFTSNTPVRNTGQVQLSGNSVMNSALDLIRDGRIQTMESSSSVINGPVTLSESEVFTGLDSSIRFNDAVTGSGSFTGSGIVEFDGVFDHGNVAMLAEFEGDVSLLSNSTLMIELGGSDSGLFDQLMVAGDLSLAGDLSVSLVGGFELTDGAEFLFADVGGTLMGRFNELEEGALVGNFGGQDLFIGYGGGDGNDVRLFTASAVPEPDAVVLLAIFALCGMARRHKRVTIQRKP